jgi:hypothetical protein
MQSRRTHRRTPLIGSGGCNGGWAGVGGTAGEEAGLVIGWLSEPLADLVGAVAESDADENAGAFIDNDRGRSLSGDLLRAAAEGAGG